MGWFTIDCQLKENELIFTVRKQFLTPLILQGKLQRAIFDNQWLNIEYLYHLLKQKFANMRFCIEDYEIEVKIAVGTAKKVLYVPLSEESIELLSTVFDETLVMLGQSTEQTNKQIQEEQNRFQKEKQQAMSQFHDHRENCHRGECNIRQSSQLIVTITEDLLKLNRQILIIDEQIMACKRGLELEQYRSETSSQNRQQRRRKVYINELSKLKHPKIEKAIRQEGDTQRIELAECELRAMKFVEIFQHIQELKLPNNAIRKIEGLTTLLQLRKLDLSHNIIQKLQGFNNTLQLREMLFQHNRIIKLENVFHLIHIQVLALSQNLIEEIPRDINMLEALIQVRLINNNINQLPWELLSLHKLRIISILGNPCFRDNHKSKELINKLFEAQIQTCCSVF